MKSFLPSREQIPIMVTLAILLSLGAMYYYNYLPASQTNVNRWKFRTLQNVNDNIRAKMDNGYMLLENYLKPGLDKISYHKENKNIKLLKDLPLDTISLVTDKKDTIPKFSITDDNQLLITRMDSAGNLRISLRYKFDDFLKPLLPDFVFDHYIVVNDKAVVYQTFSSGLDYSADSLQKYLTKTSGTTIKDKEFGGISYKLFMQPVVYDSSTKFIVIGLLTQEHYDQETSKLAPSVILLLITLFTFIVITFPVIKIYNLRKEDRLTITDALSSTVVLMAMMSLLFFIFIKYDFLFTEEVKEDPKRVVAKGLETAFLKEVKDGIDKLSSFDCMATESKIIDTLYGIGKYRSSNTGKAQNDCVETMASALDFDRIFWMNEKGVEINAWKSDSIEVFFPGKFAKRAYFKTISQKLGYSSYPQLRSKFYVDQIYSWIDGKFFTVLAIPSNVPGMKVVAITINLLSLDSLKIIPGYSFAFVDKSGKVLYHSKRSKNLNENLLLEFSESDRLAGAIKTESSSNFKTDYFGHKYDVYIQPISMLPYHLVIMDDLMYKEYRDIDVYSFTFSMQFTLFLFFTIQMLAVFFASSHRSLYKLQLFETSWVGPKKSSHKEYILATIFNLYIAALLCLFSYDTVMSRFYITFFAISLLPVFLNLLFVKKYYAEENIILSKYKMRAMLCALSFPVALSLLSPFVLGDSLSNLLEFQILCIFPILIVLNFGKTFVDVTKFIESLASKTKYNQTFTALIFSGIVVTNGIPIIIFFTSSFNYDQHLIARSKQLELAKNLHNNTIEVGRKNNFTPYDIYKDSLWVKNVGTKKPSDTLETREDRQAARFLNDFRVYQSGHLLNIKDLYTTKRSGRFYFFNNIMRQVTAEKDSTVTNIQQEGDSSILLESSALNFSFPSLLRINGIIFWFVFGGLLTAILFLIYNLVNKIYSLKLPETKNWEYIDDEILTNKELNNFVFLIKTPGADPLEFIEKIIRSHEPNIPRTGQVDKDHAQLKKYYKEIDFSKPDEKTNSFDKTLDDFREKIKLGKDTQSLIVIHHFEHNFKDSASNLEKLKKLEDIYRTAKEKNQKILILSTIHPGTLIEALDESDDKKTDHKTSERWQVLLANFRMISQKLQRFSVPDANLTSAIYKETQYTDYANKLAEPAMRIFKANLPNDEENISYKLQLTSYHFYGALWQSFSKEEKFMLYDLAEDGLVNSYDKNTLYLLLEKGIVVQNNGMLKIFSRGFRSYILAGLGSYEMEKLIEKINDNRNWNKIKLPLTLVSIAIIGFLFSSQHETSTKLLTSLGALATILPTIINFLSSMGGDGSSQKGKG
ncbi:cache domain-containing protein [Dyadobacter sp. CY345]|uniref:cache domain-containing protein n=1 Tax=Dyadobacter sp. CY345 TaxID=2909335 RepID=UPI001F27DD7E|nr:cache domain-containing protein [Dyadobacter sp. CY345]MCF2447289.1 cache domain-containing protein [Dyadobacter sp. CY345]